MPKVKAKHTRPSQKNTYDTTYAHYLQQIERAISHAMTGESIVCQAARHSLSAGGKRIRPVLLLDFAQQGPTPRHSAIAAALAVEMVHTFSLIHDDLPCIDNATLRRGRPCAHKVYGEAAGLLAGDILLNEAFRVLAHNYPAAVAGRLTGALAQATYGVIEGEWADIEAEHQEIDDVDIDFVYLNKTGRMLGVPAAMGLILQGYSDKKIAPVVKACEEVGIAFQIVDDLLDIHSNAAQLGKDVGQDERKKTYLKRYGEKWCRQEVDRLSASALKVFHKLPHPQFILELTQRLIHRTS